MPKFVLMQNPSKRSEKDPSMEYYTIGLEEKWKSKAFDTVSKEGVIEGDNFVFDNYPNKLIALFAFIDEEARVAWKGDIAYKDGESFPFAVIKRK